MPTEGFIVMLRLCLAVALTAASVTIASAQTIVVKPAERPAAQSPQVRVTVGVNLFVPATDDNSDQSLKAQEDARRKIYELAGHECAVLHDVLASECWLDSININVQRINGNPNWNPQQHEGFNLNGNIGFRVTPK